MTTLVDVMAVLDYDLSSRATERVLDDLTVARQVHYG